MPLWTMAFRPFFLLGAGYSILALLTWGLMFSGLISWSSHLPGRTLHGHEMLFGFAGAAIAGFLLTAVATWTQRPHVCGGKLLWLVAAWILARLAVLFPEKTGIWLSAVSGLSFWIFLGVLMTREVVAARNRRNYKVIPLIASFAVLEGLFFFGSGETAEASIRAGLFLIINMIMLVAGRIIPAFTNNWINLNRRETSFRLPTFDRFDLLALAMTDVFAVFFVLEPETDQTAYLGTAAATLQFGRILRWRGWLTRQEPLLLILHIAYGWIPVGLALLSLSHFFGHQINDAGIHALTFGAMGTLILGVSARVALGHTGRRLTTFPSIRLAFFLITIGALLRVLFPGNLSGMQLSVLLWSVAYLLFLLRYIPILLSEARVE